MLSRLLGKEVFRKHQLAKTKSKVMSEFYSFPFPPKSSTLDEVKIIALDLETTGLDLDNDEILSFGLVEISQMEIQLGSCWHKFVRIDERLPEETVVIHQITDDISAAGTSLEELLPEVLKKLQGNVLLAHHAIIETSFLNKACQALYNTEFDMPVIDTQVLAARHFERSRILTRPGDLRLFNLSKRFNLPTYKSHNALMDALTTAECFLVLSNELSPFKTPDLRSVLR